MKVLQSRPRIESHPSLSERIRHSKSARGYELRHRMLAKEPIHLVAPVFITLIDELFINAIMNLRTYKKSERTGTC